ncbi:hypothetical protein [Comamonas endophytica]|uniref:Capsular polysaccharide biosynthesis protein n=1 Tax=Comamonas endophytica TaxID=2949090 RepID=A0ABY6G6N2_9BURK|nr:MULTISPECIES: hypothetical protein [unclassified Acidovorax]MCD2512420.1 hypothetical protein [Acidovorax sp. D4N7]UYG50134.1 hypothetical protein M9799_08340 [Acidovorax sp. 5MLIR]
MNKLVTPLSVNSVALTCDFLRAQPGIHGFTNFQQRNLAWLAKVTGASSTWESWGIKTDIITAPTEPKNFRGSLGSDNLYSEYLENPDQAWASTYDNDSLQVFPGILNSLLMHDLVVGFELPPTLKRALDKEGKRYISFYIHPVRFLRDLCFLVTTNCTDIAKLIAQDEVASHEIYYQARRFSALFSRLQLPALSFPENVPVLIGQTERDSVLIRDGRFITWADYDNALAQTLEPYSEVIFLEHPYRKNSAVNTEYLRGRHGKTVISFRGNSYGVIFSQVESPFFLTLSSSLGIEAQCAGKKCTFLSSDPCKKFILDGVDVPNAAMVSHAVLQDEFWRTIFSTQYQKKKVRENAFALGDHFIRNSLESWAFRPLQFGAKIDPVRKLILPSATVSENRLAAVSTELRGEATGRGDQPFIHGCKEHSWGTVEILSKPFAKGPPTKIDFSEPSVSHYLVEGFHKPESWGVWSCEKDAKIVLPLDISEASEVQIKITIGVKVLPEILDQAPVLQITMAGSEIGFVLFRKSAKNDQTIHFTRHINYPVCQLEFSVSHTGSPALLSRSADQRILGFGIFELSVEILAIPANTHVGSIDVPHNIILGGGPDQGVDDSVQRTQ